MPCWVCTMTMTETCYVIDSTEYWCFTIKLRILFLRCFSAFTIKIGNNCEALYPKYVS